MQPSYGLILSNYCSGCLFYVGKLCGTFACSSLLTRLSTLRLPTHGGLYAWEFEKDKREVRVRVEGQLVLSTSVLILNAALDWFGLAYLPEDQVKTDLADGRLVRVLADWCEPFPGYHLYHPSRRQPTAAFVLLVEALRYRE